MVRWLAGCFLALVVPTAASGGEPVPVRAVTLHASASVDVDAAGNARVVEMGAIGELERSAGQSPIARAIEDQLRPRIESWQFAPATEGGIAVPSRTHVHVSMKGVDDGKGRVEVTILSANTGGELKDKRMLDLMIAIEHALAEGRVTVTVDYDASGSVIDARILNGMGFHHGEFRGALDRKLEKGALAAAKKWVFSPEIVNGRPLAGSGDVPIRFCFSTACRIAAASVDDSSKGQGQFASTDPAVKLRSAVAGTAL